MSAHECTSSNTFGPLLVRVWSRWVHRALGYRTREAYARERLGMDPTRARALVRLERTAVQSEPFARAYRSGALSWVRAKVLAPLVSADPLGRFVEDWVAWAERVTVRRLREDMERALALSETGPEAFRAGGGLPPEAREEREIGAPCTATGEPAVAGDDREIGAGLTLPATPAPQESAPEEPCCARFIGPADVVQLFRAVLCTVRRRMEREEGRLPTPGREAGGAPQGVRPRRLALHGAGMHLDAEPARSPHPLPLRGRGRRPGKPDGSLCIPSSPGSARGAAAVRGAGARRAAVGDGDPPRRDAADGLPLGGPPGAGSRAGRSGDMTRFLSRTRGIGIVSPFLSGGPSLLDDRGWVTEKVVEVGQCGITCPASFLLVGGGLN